MCNSPHSFPALPKSYVSVVSGIIEFGNSALITKLSSDPLPNVIFPSSVMLEFECNPPNTSRLVGISVVPVPLGLRSIFEFVL